jgi:hypothetical protein
VTKKEAGVHRSVAVAWLGDWPCAARTNASGLVLWAKSLSSRLAADSQLYFGGRDFLRDKAAHVVRIHTDAEADQNEKP